MKKTLFILVIVIITGCRPLMAQFDTQLSNYWAAINYYNPGYAGQAGVIGLTALSRMQWLGIPNAPRTAVVIADMPFSIAGREHGIGASFYTEKIGLFSATIASAQYAYKAKMLKGNFGIGIQLGYIGEKFNATGIKIPQNNEEK
jgi:type IX secretion system PorP/SprF family membrane protein